MSGSSRGQSAWLSRPPGRALRPPPSPPSVGAPSFVRTASGSAAKMASNSGSTMARTASTCHRRPIDRGGVGGVSGEGRRRVTVSWLWNPRNIVKPRSFTSATRRAASAGSILS